MRTLGRTVPSAARRVRAASLTAPMRARRRLLVPLLLAALAPVACGGDDPEQPAAEEAGSAALDSKPEVEVPEGEPPEELQVEDIVEGDGAAAAEGDALAVQYVGVTYATGEEFDSSWERGESFLFQLGAGMVIEGWDEGLEGMRVGGRRQLVIPSELAYGSSGSPPAIGPDETLVFVIDLVELQ